MENKNSAVSFQHLSIVESKGLFALSDSLNESTVNTKFEGLSREKIRYFIIAQMGPKERIDWLGECPSVLSN